VNLKSLIQNQKLRIDNHNRGNVVSADLKCVHIHKSFYCGKRRGKSVRISIKGDKKIDFDREFDDKERQAIVKEISAVLEKDKEKLLKFSRYVADALYRWSAKEITLEEAQQYAAGIAKSFELESRAREELIKKVGENLVQYISIHADSSGQLYTINQKLSSIIIRPGSAI
jgi:hypothetical protein